MTILALLTTSALAFLPPTVRLTDGKRVSLHGSGPPVVFSSGLFGLMPRRIYTKLFRELRKDLTLVVLEDALPVTSEVVADVARALAVDRVGFLSHSSIDRSILESPFVERAVLCDPVVMPTVGLEGFAAPTVSSAPTLVLRAGLAYAGDVQIPAYVSPQFDGDEAVVKTYEGLGHADVLDDPWAELGPRMLPWMTGLAPERTSFAEWTRAPRLGSGSLVDRRAAYRDWIASHAITFLRTGHTASEAPPHDVLVDLEERVTDGVPALGDAEDRVDDA